MEVKVTLLDSRKSRQCKNVTFDWPDFAKRCQTTKTTAETLAAYMAMSKDAQGDIKDVGGFVGCWVTDETAGRKKPNIAFRSMLTIDIDNAGPELWPLFRALYPGTAVCYSTHRHTPEKPRYRIVVPFDREVMPEEYEPISRQFCKRYGLLECTDPASHKISQLFYWPSTPTGAEFFSELLNEDGAPLNADSMLAGYADWHDVSQWPTAAGESKGITAGMKKAGDPTEKPGLIGAFCRTYSIEEAAEKFLPDIYDPCAMEGRYTYMGGSTSGGAVTYEGKFMHSHHESDPAHGLHNAFDVVRLHKFGDLDEGVKPDTPVNKLPSYLAMCDFCLTDTDTKKTLMEEKQREAAADFAGLDFDAEGDVAKHYAPVADAEGDVAKHYATVADTEGVKDLTLDRKGNALNTGENLNAIFLNDPLLKRVRYNAFADKDVTDVRGLQGTHGEDVDDTTSGRIADHVEKVYGLKLTVKKVDERLSTTAPERSFNPVQDFITSTKWDGTPRVDTLLIDYLGADDNAANREVMHKWAVAAVKRAFEPGCTFQNVLTLTGGQGIGKSVFLATLARSAGWFNDNIDLSAKDKDINESLRGRWIMEIAELAGLSRADWQSVKGFISRDSDKYRAAYARRATDNPRRCVFAATTNSIEFLRDADKGNRRWWVVPVKGTGAVSGWVDRLRAEVPQIWAEAYTYYLNGEDICNLSDQTAKHMFEMQWQYSEDASDPMREEIIEYLDILLPVDWSTRGDNSRRQYIRDRDPLEAVGTVRRDTVRAREFLWEALGIQSGAAGHGAEARKFNRIMRSLPDWEETRTEKARAIFRRRSDPDPEDELL